MNKILHRIDSPEDLKELNEAELNLLSEEMRELLVETVSSNGGHLSSNLGVVELTIALHRVFDSPRDKIVWDVGHQCYNHKLLTGRHKTFSTIRQYKGLSGFPDRIESPHDAFIGGHAGTSISAALGMALARDIKKENYNVAAVIGDGSLGAGVALEAVNHAGHIGTNFTVILNDNGMAISPSVGALYKFLNKVRFNRKYEETKKGLRKKITGLFGERFWSFSKRLKRKFEDALLPGRFWNELGFIYLGPVDGHNIEEIEAALRRAHDFELQPTLVHIVTSKGKGFEPAESNATKYHGVSPKTKSKSSSVSYSQAFSESILQLMREDKRIVAITAAMLDGTGLTEAADEFPDRVFDVGICEQHAVTLAAGLATRGFIPVVAIYSTFLQRAYDQVVHDVCLQDLPVIFAIDRGGIVGDDGKTHQGALDISYLRCIPNISVAAPGDISELHKLFKVAVESGRPAAIRYPRGSDSEDLAIKDNFITIGKGEVLKDGNDIAIFAIGSTVQDALSAGSELGEYGIDCAVINARYAKPIDRELITEYAQRTRRIITVEENALQGGFGTALLEVLAREKIKDVETECIGLPDIFIEHGTQNHMRGKYGLDTKGIITTIRETFPELFLEIYDHKAEYTG